MECYSFCINNYKKKMRKLIGSEGMKLKIISLLLAVLSISISCTKTNMNNTSGTTNGTGSNPAGGPGANQVWIQGMAFVPAILNVNTGARVTWTNYDSVDHTVTSDAATFDSGSLANKATFSYTFTTAGTYSYHCKIHPAMMATVVVTDAMTGTGF